jgi:hypothetical protein
MRRLCEKTKRETLLHETYRKEEKKQRDEEIKSTSDLTIEWTKQNLIGFGQNEFHWRIHCVEQTNKPRSAYAIITAVPAMTEAERTTAGKGAFHFGLQPAVSQRKQKSYVLTH